MSGSITGLHCNRPRGHFLSSMRISSVRGLCSPISEVRKSPRHEAVGFCKRVSISTCRPCREQQEQRGRGASSSRTPYPSPRRRRQGSLILSLLLSPARPKGLAGVPYGISPRPPKEKAHGTRPWAFVSGTSISTCRPCREQQEQRGRGASSSRTPYPSPRRRRQGSLILSLLLSPARPKGLAGVPYGISPRPPKEKAHGTRPWAFVSGTSISTCRPCREQQEQRERGARACR